MSLLDRSDRFLPRPELIESATALEARIRQQTDEMRTNIQEHVRQNMDSALVPDHLPNPLLFSIDADIYKPVDPTTIAETKDFFNRILTTSNFIELSMLSRMINASARARWGGKILDPFDARARRRREFLRIRQVLESNRVSYDVPKTGGDLQLIGHATGVLFRNSLPTVGLHIWQKVSAFMPVAPILKVVANAREESTVYTRFCGLPLGTACEIFKDTSDTTYQMLRTQYLDILARLLNLNIAHGHPHSWNLTVEFVRRDALRAHAASLGLPNETDTQLLDGRIVNTLPFNERDIMFDPVPYSQHVEEFIPVARLIDFDLASEQSLAGRTGLGPDERHYTRELERGDKVKLKRLKEAYLHDADFQARIRAFNSQRL